MSIRTTGSRCPWCRGKFHSRKILDDHKRRAHPKLVQADDDRRDRMLRDLAKSRTRVTREPRSVRLRNLLDDDEDLV